jgi:16S rRNA A1518/A1519 N6-dimethyltransferase RsmA/KsgA/DIM1 with predicted DNA glycosylase/AP lyase activity
MLINNLHESFNIDKDELQSILNNMGLDKHIRAEQVTIRDFIRISEEIKALELS